MRKLIISFLFTMGFFGLSLINAQDDDINQVHVVCEDGRIFVATSEEPIDSEDVAEIDAYVRANYCGE